MRKLLNKIFKTKKAEPLQIPKKLPRIKNAPAPLIRYIPGGDGDAVWNPLLGYPRNCTCWCGSKKKAKGCCLPFVNRVISKTLAERITSQWESYLNGEVTLPGVPR